MKGMEKGSMIMSCLPKMMKDRCIMIPVRFLENMDMRDMRFPIMRNKDLNVSIIWDTGKEQNILELVQGQHL